MLRLASKPRTYASRNALHTAIADRVPFTSSGALSADTRDGDGLLWDAGQLPREHRDTYRAEQPTYVVWSYSTPIAWWSEEHGWTIPNTRYSVTTGGHQSQVRMAVA